MKTNDDLMKGTEVGEQLIEVSEVKNTPFNIVKTEKGYFVVMGQHRISHVLATLKEAQDDAKRKDWNRLVQIMALIADMYTTPENKSNLTIKK